MDTMKKADFNTSFYSLTPSLNSFAYNLTKDSEEAKDLYQETAFRAITNREKFKAGTNLKAWLFTIMKNIFINNYRKRSKANTIMDNTDNMYFLNSSENAISNGAGTNIMMDELNTMIQKLEESIRVPFQMHYVGFKYQEIADKLELPLGTVKSRIFFARKELKSQIKGQYGNYTTIRSKLSA
ncbi:MAG: RNA polymerase sigma-70 factor (ECF subfamily) [Saprospiraceae bacterium]|jgi:RNA polymerase sigma-70 factor (ECF subfamily)